MLDKLKGNDQSGLSTGEQPRGGQDQGDEERTSIELIASESFSSSLIESVQFVQDIALDL